ncbi:MAG: WD40 repeat domain-containing protein, partial [Ktedonobacteraceae bacterium]|nr:WD40 repeat domain-containing protein [Ktedonobacteraceae bacterium]
LPTYRPASARDVQQELRQIILQQLPAHSFLRLRIEPPRIPTPTATSWYTPGGQQQQQQLQQQASSTISRRKVLTRIGIGALALGTGSIGWNIWQQANRHNDTLRTLNGYPGRVNALTWSPNNRYIASGTHDQSLYIHRIRTYRGRVRAETTGVWEGSNTLSFNRYGDYSPIASLSWSPEGDRLAVIRQGDLITLTPYGEQLSNLDIASGRTRMTPTLVAWSPYDTNFIATAGNTREAAIWDLTTGEQSYTSHYHTSFISAIACSPHTKEIASGDTNGYIMLWSMSGDAMVRIYDRHRTSASAAILALTWSPGGHYIASTAQGQAVHVWRTSDLQHRLIYTGHTGDVNALAWSPGGHYIASASDDGTVQVWVALSGKHFYTYSGHDGPVRSVTWSPDGRYIASGGDDKTVQIWQPE